MAYSHAYRYSGNSKQRRKARRARLHAVRKLVRLTEKLGLYDLELSPANHVLAQKMVDEIP